MRDYTVFASFVLVFALLPCGITAFSCTIPTQIVYVQSTSILCSLPYQPTSEITVSFTVSGSPVTFEPSTLVFTPDLWYTTFTVITSAVALVVVNYEVSTNTDGIINGISSFYSEQRTVNVPGGDTTLVINEESQQFLIYLNYPTINGLDVQLIPSSKKLTFSSNPVSFSPGDDFAYFTVTSSEIGYPYITFNVTGEDALFYYVTNDLFYFITEYSTNEVITIQTIPTLQIDQITAPLIAFISSPSADGLTVELTAPDVTFNPPILNFQGSQQVAFFTATADTATEKNLNFFTGGDDIEQYLNISATVFEVDLGYFTVLGPSGDSFYVNQEYLVGITASFPSVNGVTITPFGANLNFTPSYVTFDSNITATVFSFVILPEILWYSETATAYIYFTVTGPDADLFEAPGNLAYGVYQFPIAINIISSEYASGVWSVPNYVTLSVPPLDSVTITPYADLGGLATFQPNQLVFNSNTTGPLSFTIYPPLGIPASFYLAFAITGPCAYLYASAPIYYSTVTSREFQIYPAPNAIDNYVGFPSGPFTASVNIAPTTNFSVDLSGAFLDISPSVLTFTPTVTAVSFTYTPTVYFEDVLFYFQAVFSGIDALQYTQPADYGFYVYQRYLYLSLTSSEVKQGTAVQIIIYTSPAPNNNLQVTPINPNLIFGPSTISFSSGQTQKILSVTGQIPGVHTVSWNLTGTDAAWYGAPETFTLTVEQAYIATPKGYLSEGSNLRGARYLLFSLAVALLGVFVL